MIKSVDVVVEAFGPKSHSYNAFGGPLTCASKSYNPSVIHKESLFVKAKEIGSFKVISVVVVSEQFSTDSPIS